jgi:exonuclease SbcC
MIPIRLEIENFISHSNSVLDFTRFKAALVVGVHDGNPDISNGVGKTAIFDSMRWVLFGKSRFSTKDKVIKRGKVECKVDFIFMVGDATYRIVRKLNLQSNQFDVTFEKLDGDEWKHEGLTGSTNTATNRKIVETIGLSNDTFINSVYFKQNDISGFALAPTSKKKDILKEILQIGLWDDFQKAAKEAEKKLNAKRDSLQSRIDGLGDIEVEQAQNKERLEKKVKELSEATNQVNDLESQLRKCEEEIADLEVVLDKLGITNKKRLETKLSSISSRALEIRNRRDHLKNEVKLNNDTIVVSDNECRKLEVKLGELSNTVLVVEHPSREDVEKVFELYSKERKLPPIQYSTELLEKRHFEKEKQQRALDLLKLQIRQLTTLEPGAECPTCLTEIENLDSVTDRRQIKKSLLEKKIIERDAALADLDAIIKKDELAIKEADQAILEIERVSLIIAKQKVSSTESERRNGEVQKELIKLSKEWKDLRLEKEQIVEILDNINDVDKGQEELDRVYDNKKKIFRKLEVARKEVMRLSIEHGNISGYSEELERRVSERNTLVDQKNTLLFDIEAYSGLTKTFGKDGIQAIIMENVTEDLRKYTNTILRHICSEPMSIEFVTQRQTGSGNWKEDFEVKISIDSSVVDFEDLSGGEQVRVAFALRLALSRLLMRRVGSNIQFLLLDEIDQSLDRYGIEVLAESIHALSDEFKILVITHNEFMKEKFDHIITVQKQDTGSILKQ